MGHMLGRHSFQTSRNLPFINTAALARCFAPQQNLANRFNGFLEVETVKTVKETSDMPYTGLKPGVNESAQTETQSDQLFVFC